MTEADVGIQLINGLAVIGAATCAWLMVRGASTLRWSPLVPPAAAPSPPRQATAPDQRDGDIPAIAAAVYAIMGAHRIVHIEDHHAGLTWTSEGRWMHQTSHRTH
jgi:hypothetical protein